MKECRRMIASMKAGSAPRRWVFHLQRCAACRDRSALWELLGKSRGLEPRRAFTDRLLQLASRQPLARPMCAAGDEQAGSGLLEAFADFPPGSLGWLLFAVRGG